MDGNFYLRNELLWQREETYAIYQITWQEWLAIVTSAMEGGIGPRI